MKRGLAILLVVLLLGWWLWPVSPIRHAPGVLVSGEPLQAAVADVPPWPLESYTITPLATFQATGRVLSISRYRFDREAQIAPYDLALGWGVMSDQGVVDHLEISQGSRWYRYRWRGSPPADPRAMQASSTNIHLIPADSTIRRQIARLRAGHIVGLRGYLIQATTEDGWHWRSSLSRSDTGSHACEVLWVEQVVVAGEE
jgi:hypothetical protein